MNIDVTVIGGGMIVHDQILPSLYHLQRLGAVGQISVCATRSVRMRDLVNDRFARAFPGQTFSAYPALDADPAKNFGDLYKEVVPKMAKHNLVLIATPDHLHHEMVTFALEHDQHVVCVKPLVQKVAHAREIEKLAAEKGLFVGVEYHKRFDRRSLEARDLYRQGRFGTFRCGESKLIEPYYYRHSNFQSWFTCEQADPFTYVGCHYVDLVYFITGLRPVEVAVRGVEGKFPNGNTGYMWTSGQVVFENDAILSVTTGLGYPDRGAGSNDQGMCLFCEGDDCGATIKHDDQFRGVSHGYVEDGSPAIFRYVNPDYFRLVPWIGPGLKPIGYGYDSIEANVLAVQRLMSDTQGSGGDAATEQRRKHLSAIDEAGIIATPANSVINEAVNEAARQSIREGGKRIAFQPL